MTRNEKRLIALSQIGICVYAQDGKFCIIETDTGLCKWYVGRLKLSGAEIGDDGGHIDALDIIDEALKMANLPSLEEAYELINVEG